MMKFSSIIGLSAIFCSTFLLSYSLLKTNIRDVSGSESQTVFGAGRSSAKKCDVDPACLAPTKSCGSYTVYQCTLDFYPEVTNFPGANKKCFDNQPTDCDSDATSRACAHYDWICDYHVANGNCTLNFQLGYDVFVPTECKTVIPFEQ